MEYYPALLWLVDQVGEARTANVLAEFDRQFGHIIPPEHREQNESGHARWEHFVHWARLVLVQVGFMTSGKRGVWGITAAGRAWLEGHPDGGDWHEIKALTHKTAAKSASRDVGTEIKAMPNASSTEPQTLRTAMDYRPALLWLMGELGDSGASAAVKAFDQSLGKLIPSEHRKPNKSGRLRWDEYVRWARQDLINAGLMESGKRGLWSISVDGRAWLQAHPDGGQKELLERLQRSRSTGTGVDLPIRTTPVQPAKRQAVQLRGRTYELSSLEVLAAVRAEMTRGMPREASSFKDWFLLVDGQRVSVKWVVGLVTGLPHSDFQTSEARRVLRTLGLEVGDAGTEESEKASTVSFPQSLDYSAFFRVVQEQLKGRLPASLGSHTVKHHANYAQISCPIPRSHFELRLGRTYTELALHLEGKQEQNLKILNHLHSHVEALQAQLGEPVLAEPWGQDWARMYLRRSPGRMDSTTARSLAADWLRFIVATLPILEAIARDLTSIVRRGRPAAVIKQEDLTRQRAILAEEIREVKGFLAGNRSAIPSDEKLCDWVQFCYSFELFAEAASLFKLIRPEQVNPWLYERVKRLARACELHINYGR